MIYVYKLPSKLSNGHCSGGGQPIEFTNVDWFNDYEELTRDRLEDFIAEKVYYDPNASYLILRANHWDSFVIGGLDRGNS